MALRFDFTACNEDTLPDAAVRDAFIWGTMFTGINHITPENAREFFARISLIERVSGPFLYDVDENDNHVERPITPDDVLSMVGLKTNASPKTITQFRKGLWESHLQYNVPNSVG